MRFAKLTAVFVLMVVLNGCAAVDRPMATAVQEEKPSGFDLGEKNEARVKAIKAEIEALGDHRWAGDYSDGGGFGFVRLALAPDAGFFYLRGGCVGIYNYDHGTVAVDADGEITLQTNLSTDDDSGRPTPTTLYPVQWGERLYLISKKEFRRFANDVNSGEAADRLGPHFYLLRSMDLERPRVLPRVDGVPTGPPELNAMFFDPPLVASVKPAGDRTVTGLIFREATTPVTIDAGSRDGIFVGMVLFPDVGEYFDKITIDHVDDVGASGVLYQELDSSRRFTKIDAISTVSSLSPRLQQRNEEVEKQLASPGPIPSHF